MSFRSKPVGWRYESHRHSLAARGVKRYTALSLFPEMSDEELSKKIEDTNHKMIEIDHELPKLSKEEQRRKGEEFEELARERERLKEQKPWYLASKKPSHIYCRNCGKHTKLSHENNSMKCEGCGGVVESKPDTQFYYEAKKQDPRRYNGLIVDAAIVGAIVYGGYVYYKHQKKKKKGDTHG